MRINNLYKSIFFILSFCFFLCLSMGLFSFSIQASKKTVTKQTSLAILNEIIDENNANLDELFDTQKQLNADCYQTINYALENNLLVNEKDYKNLQKLSSDLEKKTTKLKKAKTQQDSLQEEIDAVVDTKSSDYRKMKCEVITLQKRQLKLIAQINKVTKKIIKLCTPSSS